jgi:hypothetical protein
VAREATPKLGQRLTCGRVQRYCARDVQSKPLASAHLVSVWLDERITFSLSAAKEPLGADRDSGLAVFELR